MASIPGRLLGLQVNGVFISCELSCDFTFQSDMLPASAVDSGRWKEFIAGIRSWSMSVNGQLLAEAAGADFKTLMLAAIAGDAVLVRWGTRTSAVTQMAMSGLAIPSNLQGTGPNKGSGTWTATLQGTGELDTDFQNFQLIIDAMPAEADYPIIYDLNVT